MQALVSAAKADTAEKKLPEKRTMQEQILRRQRMP